MTRRRAGGSLPVLVALALLAACEGPGNRTAGELYPKYCARCHGADGRGVPRQLARYPKADLTRSPAKGGAARDFFYRRIAQGYGPMPPFKRRLSQQEIERLVDYTLALARGEAPPRAREGGN